jgi:DNA-directed RNA polymerase subunit RPC12/RpoP
MAVGYICIISQRYKGKHMINHKGIYCQRCGKIELHMLISKDTYKCVRCGKVVKDALNPKPNIIRLR